MHNKNMLSGNACFVCLYLHLSAALVRLRAGQWDLTIHDSQIAIFFSQSASLIRPRPSILLISVFSMMSTPNEGILGFLSIFKQYFCKSLKFKKKTPKINLFNYVWAFVWLPFFIKILHWCLTKYPASDRIRTCTYVSDKLPNNLICVLDFISSSFFMWTC